MPDLSASSLEPYSHELFAAVTRNAGSLPTRLAMNIPLASDLGQRENWFYGRTFPLWAAGKVRGLKFKASQASYETVLLGSKSGPDGAVHELEQAVFKRQEAAGALWQQSLHCGVTELLATEFCHRVGLCSSRILCLILDTGIPQNPAIYATRVSRLPFTIGQLRYAHQILSPATFAELVSFLKSQTTSESADNRVESASAKNENAVVNGILAAAATWQAEGFYCSAESLENLTLAGEIRLFSQNGFIETLTDNFDTFSGESRRISDFQNQPERIVDLCIGLTEMMDSGLGVVDMEDIRVRYRQRFEHYFEKAMLRKFGLKAVPGLRTLIDDGLTLVTESQVNYTEFFQLLTKPEGKVALSRCCKGHGNFDHWLSDYHHALNDVGLGRLLSRLDPSDMLSHHHIEATLTSLRQGNRNAVDNMLESIQSGRQLVHYHWAS